MKIVHISPTYAPVLGGAELHMKELSEGLASRGHEVTVLTVNTRSIRDFYSTVPGDLAEAEVINGVRIVRLKKEGELLGIWMNQWLRLPGGWRSLRFVFGESGFEMLLTRPQSFQLIPYLIRSRADIVMAMNWFLPLAYHAYLARKLREFVFVGVPQFHTHEAWCDRKIYREMLASCSAVVANTEDEEKFMRAHGANRVEVAGVGVHPELFAQRSGLEIRARYALGNAPVVGFVGRQGVNKGVVQLVEAMEMVWQWNPEVRLVLAGHRSSEHHDIEIKNAIDRLSAFQRQRLIRINRFEEKEKSSLYDAFDVFALPSTGESFGLSYLEAWMCKKPVIGARIGSTQCVIADGVDGLLVDPTDPKDIANKIIELLSDREKREGMGMRGYSKTMAQYTWEKVVDRVEALYRDLHAAKGSTNMQPAIRGDASRGA